MQLVPIFDDDNNELGHVPNSSSKNAVCGVMHCATCGDIATVHKASGKRSNQLYTICTNDAVDESGAKVCGATNQEGGQARQNRIKKEMRRTVEALESTETIAEENVTPTPKPDINPQNEAERVTLQTAPMAVCTVKSNPMPEQPKKPDITQKEKPIGLFALVGAGIGGLLAFMS